MLQINLCLHLVLPNILCPCCIPRHLLQHTRVSDFLGRGEYKKCKAQLLPQRAKGYNMPQNGNFRVSVRSISLLRAGHIWDLLTCIYSAIERGSIRQLLTSLDSILILPLSVTIQLTRKSTKNLHHGQTQDSKQVLHRNPDNH